VSGQADIGSAATVEEVRDRLAEQGTKYLFGAYVDMHGVPKSKCVPISHMTSAFKGSELYTVGALEGMGDLGPNEDECQGHPDLAGLTVLPWDRRFAVAPANLTFHGSPYTHDTRHRLQLQLEELAQLGLKCNMGIEPEVYVLRQGDDGFEPWIAEDGLNLPTRGYDLETTMLADAFLEPMVEYMNELGWDVYSFDHEGGDGQYEFEFRYTDALRMADRMVLFRLLAKHVARSLGCIATFMPKPFSDNFGSGAHMNISLADLDTGENRFEGSGEGAAAYTDLARHFTAGLLEHAGAITAIVCSTVNSYKRLTPVGHMQQISWAPVYRAYGHNNRTLMCRLPVNRHCVELRSADSACNFYLATAVAIGAGLDGIRRELDPGEPVNADTYGISDAELAASGVDRLPATLGEAVVALERDELVREVMGAELHDTYVAAKRQEWENYNTVVTRWELDEYLHRW
jgi:glutamine synthetase